MPSSKLQNYLVLLSGTVNVPCMQIALFLTAYHAVFTRFTACSAIGEAN